MQQSSGVKHAHGQTEALVSQSSSYLGPDRRSVLFPTCRMFTT